jgi:signal transduction histidine kinase
VNRLRTFMTAHGLDALIVALAVAAAAGIASREDPSRPEGIRLVFEVAAVATMIAALLLRRRAPLVVPAGTWLVSAALSFLDGGLIVGQGPVSIAGMVAAVLLGNLREVRQARVGLAVVVVSATCVVLNDPTHSWGDLFFTPLLFAVGWLVGFALHERSEQTQAAEQRAARAEREREGAARVAVAEERARIARELHDVVAHAVSVMVLQVGAVRHRMPDEDGGSREALRNVEQAGRTALAEMRRLLDAMRREEDHLDLAPQPGMDKLAGLLTDVRAAGLDVRLEVEGDPVPLSPGLDLSAYRIVQEGLTNALKHAHAEHALVRIRYGAADLELEVHDDGRGAGVSDGLGHGLVGIGERVKIFGGEMSAGPMLEGGFALRALLPMAARVSR